MQEMWVPSLGREDPLEKGMATRETHGQRSLVGYSPRGRKESDRTEQLTLSLWLVQGTGPGPENEVVIHVSAQLLRGVCWGGGGQVAQRSRAIGGQMQ